MSVSALLEKSIITAFYNYYGLRYKSPNTQETERRADYRIVNGIQHGLGCLALIQPFNKLYQRHVLAYPNFIKEITKQFNLTEEALTDLLEVTALFHDTGRQGDGEDLWDKESAENLYQFLVAEQIDKRLARLLSLTIQYKDEPHSFIRHASEISSSPHIDFLRQLINSVDTLEVLRVRQVFYTRFLPITQLPAEDIQFSEELVLSLDELIKHTAKKIDDEHRACYTQQSVCRVDNSRLTLKNSGHRELHHQKFMESEYGQIVATHDLLKAKPKGSEETLAAWVIQRRCFRNQAIRLFEQATTLSPELSTRLSLQFQRQQLGKFREEEQGLFNYLQDEFPWTLQHATPVSALNTIQESGMLASTNLLRKTDSKLSTTFATGGSGFVFFTIGGSDQNIPEFLSFSNPSVIRVPLRDYSQGTELLRPMNDMMISAPYYSALKNRRHRFQIAGHIVEIGYLGGNDPKSICKYIRVKHPDGTIKELQVPLEKEVIVGSSAYVWLSFYVLNLLRLMNEGFRQQCLQDLSHQYIEQFIKGFFNAHNLEVGIPRSLSIQDSRVSIIPFSETSAFIESAKKEEMLAALKKGDKNTIKQLLEQGMAVDCLVNGLHTPLIIALSALNMWNSAKMAEIIELLINYGANVYFGSEEYDSIMKRVMATNKKDIIDSFLRASQADINQDKEAVYTALKLCNIEILDLLEQYDLDYQKLSTSRLIGLMTEMEEEKSVLLLQRLENQHYHFNEKSGAELEAHIDLLIVLGKKQTIEYLLKLQIPFTYKQQQNIKTLFDLTPSTLAVAPVSNKKWVCIYIHHPQKGRLGVKRFINGPGCQLFEPVLYQDYDYSFERVNEEVFLQAGFRLGPKDSIKCHSDDIEGFIVVEVLVDAIPTLFKTEQSAEASWLQDEKQLSLPLAKVLTRQNSLSELLAAIDADDERLVAQALDKTILDPKGLALLKATDRPGANLTIIRRLLEKGYPANKIYQNHESFLSPLMFAILHNNTELVKLLVRYGADPNYHYLNVNSSLVFAATHNRIGMLKVLEAQGGDFNLPQHRGILVQAMFERCSDDTFYYLLPRVDVDYCYQSVNASMLAAVLDNDRWLQALRDSHADMNRPNSITGKSAYDLMSTLQQKKHRATKSSEVNYDVESIPFLLQITGQNQNPNVQQRIVDEYDIVIIGQNSPVILQELVAALKQQTGMEDNIRIAIARTGFLPVFACRHVSPPVIAINRNILSAAELDWQGLCFAVAHEAYLLRHYLNKNSSCQITMKEHLDADKEIQAQLGLTYESIMRYMRFSEAYRVQETKKTHFYWSTIYRDDNKQNYGQRIKALGVGDVLNTVDYQLKCPTPNLVLSECYSATLSLGFKECFDVENLFKSQTLKAWLFSNLVDLHDEMVPYEYVGVPSLRAKQYGTLLKHAISNGIMTDDDCHQLFRKAYDIQLPCYNYLASLCTGLEMTGYFHDLHQMLSQWVKIIKDSMGEDDPLVSLIRMVRIDNRAVKSISANLSKETVTNLIELSKNILTLYFKLEEQFLGSFGYSMHQDQHPGVKLLSRQLHFAEVFRFSDLYLPELHVNLKQLKSYISAHPYEQNVWKVLWFLGGWDASLIDSLPKPFVVEFTKGLKVELKKYKVPTVLNPPLSKLRRFRGYEIDRYRAELLTKQPSIPLPSPEEFPVEVTSIEMFRINLERCANDLVSSRTTLDNVLKALERFAIGSEEEKSYFHDFFFNNKYQLLHFERYFDFFELMKKFNRLFSKRDFAIYVSQYYNYNFIEQMTRVSDDFNRSFADFIDNLNLLKSICPYKSDLIKSLFKSHAQRCGKLPVFSSETFKLLKLANEYPGGGADYVDCFVHRISWMPFDEYHLTAHQGVHLYRILDRAQQFPSIEYGLDFGKKILQQIAELPDVDIRIYLYQEFLSVNNSPSAYRIFFEEIMEEIIKAISQDIAKKYGKDDSSQTYTATIWPCLRTLMNDCSSIDKEMLMEAIGVAVESQYTLSRRIQEQLEPEQTDYQKTQNFNILSLVEKGFAVFVENEITRYALLKFLSSAYTKDTNIQLIQQLPTHVLAKLKYSGIANNTEHPALYQIYHFFWSLSLEHRAVIIDNIIISSKQESNASKKQKAYERGYYFLVDKLFPNVQPGSDDEFALSLLSSFLATAKEGERQFILAGLMVSSKQITGKQYTAGEKLANILENLGPAGIKLAQAIHSHPDTPVSIASALAHLKGKANPPQRIHIWGQLKNILPDSLFAKITRVGALLGSASYHYAVDMRTGQEETVCLLSRPNAQNDAYRTFDHFQRMIDACPHPRLTERTKNIFSTMISSAKARSADELSVEVGDRQFAIAQTIYEDTLTIKENNQEITVHMHACTSESSGQDYRVLEKAQGISYLELLKDDSKKLEQRVIAKAVLKKELSLLFGNEYSDCDRHGEQIKITLGANNIINLGLFDFGEMLTIPFEPWQMREIADILYQVPQAYQRGEAIVDLFTNAILNVQKIHPQQSSNHLVHIQKALLSLGDFRKQLSDKEVFELFKEVIPVMHPMYRHSIEGGYLQTLGGLSWLSTLVGMVVAEGMNAIKPLIPRFYN